MLGDQDKKVREPQSLQKFRVCVYIERETGGEGYNVYYQQKIVFVPREWQATLEGGGREYQGTGRSATLELLIWGWERLTLNYWRAMV